MATFQILAKSLFHSIPLESSTQLVCSLQLNEVLTHILLTSTRAKILTLFYRTTILVENVGSFEKKVFNCLS